MKYFLQKKSFPSSLLWKKQKGGTPLRSAFLLLEFPVDSSTDIVGPAKVVAHIPFGIDIEGLVLSNDRAVTKTDDPPSPAAAARRTVGTSHSPTLGEAFCHNIITVDKFAEKTCFQA